MALRMTEEEFREWMRRQGRTASPAPAAAPEPAPALPETGEKRGKYGNCRVEIDGKKFDSKKEARYYQNELLPGLASGKYRLVLRQVAFDLPGGIRYIADFCVLDSQGQFHVIDVKSDATKKNRVYINKKKHMLDCWGLEIAEV